MATNRTRARRVTRRDPSAAREFIRQARRDRNRHKWERAS